MDTDEHSATVMLVDEDDVESVDSASSGEVLEITDDDFDWARKVRGGLNARKLRLEDESKPAADASCRKNRVGILARPMTQLNMAGKAGSVLGYLQAMYHVVDAHQRLTRECNILHKDIGTHTIFCYRKKDDEMVGVLLDYDDRLGSDLSEAETTSKLEQPSEAPDGRKDNEDKVMETIVSGLERV